MQPIENIALNAHGSCSTLPAELKPDTEYGHCYLTRTASTWPYIHAEQFNLFKTFP